MSNTSRVAAFTLGLVTTIMMIELTLRLVSVVSSSVESATDPNLETELKHFFEDTKEGKEVVRIVTMGESTTMKFFKDGKDISWPAQLERMLNESPEVVAAKKEVRVLNIAQSGTSTTFLVDELEAILSTPVALANPPQYVISMMGVNDSVSLVPQKSWLFQNSYTARLAFWAWKDFFCPDCYRISRVRDEDQIIAKDSSAYPIFNSLNTKHWPHAKFEIDALKKELDQLITQNPDSKEDLRILWGNWLYKYSEWLASKAEASGTDTRFEKTMNREELRGIALNMARDAFDSATDRLIARQGSVKLACLVYTNLNDSKTCLDLIHSSLGRGVKLTPDLLMSALHAAAGQDPRFQKIITSAGFRYLEHGLLGTRNAYLRTHELSQEHGFQWLIMQYPMGSAAGLKSFFSNLKDDEFLQRYPNFRSIYFSELEAKTDSSDRGAKFDLPHTLVSNSNFIQLAKGEDRPKYFIDLFAHGLGLPFGHTTELGHRQIAFNVASSLIPLIIGN